MARTLVTGATGFIGVRLVERLVARGDRVACLVRPTSDTGGLEPLGVERAVGSLGDAESLVRAVGGSFGGEGAEVVLHVAGLTHAWRAEDFHRVNAEGTATLCRAAAGASSPPTVVLLSSLAAAGPSPDGAPHTEATKPAPISHYGRSKLAGERAARRFADRLPLSIVRPPVVFGPGDRDGLLLFKAIRRVGVHAVPQLRGLPLSLLHVDDLVEAILAVADRGERVRGDAQGDGPIGLYYAAHPTASSYAEMGRFAAAAMGRRVWVICRRKYPFLPVAWAGDLIGRITGKPPILGTDKLREASASGWVCEPAKIADGLGWAPRLPLADAYAETHRWYVESGWL